MIHRLLFILLVSCCAMASTAAPPAPILLSHPVDRTDLDPKGLKLTWTAPDHIDSYEVQLSKDPTFGVSLVLDKATKLKPAPDKPTEVTYAVTLANGHDLDKNKEYFWRVIGTCKPDVVCPGRDNTQISETANFTTSRELFGRISRAGWKLTRGDTGEDKTKPAEFSFSDTRHKKPVFAADFLLAWRQTAHGAGQSFWSPYFSVQGALTNDPEATDANWKTKLGTRYDRSWQGSDGVTDSWIATAAGRYEASQDGKTRKELIELANTVSLHHLGIGRFSPIAPWLSISWRPYLTLDYGHNSAIGDSGEKKSTLIRVQPQVSLSFRLHALRRALNLNDVLLSVSDTGYWLPRETDKRHNLIDSSLDFVVTKGFSFGVQFKSGKEAPKFIGQRTLGLSLGLGFGS